MAQSPPHQYGQYRPEHGVQDRGVRYREWHEPAARQNHHNSQHLPPNPWWPRREHEVVPEDPSVPPTRTALPYHPPPILEAPPGPARVNTGYMPPSYGGFSAPLAPHAPYEVIQHPGYNYPSPLSHEGLLLLKSCPDTPESASSPGSAMTTMTQSSWPARVKSSCGAGRRNSIKTPSSPSEAGSSTLHSHSGRPYRVVKAKTIRHNVCFDPGYDAVFDTGLDQLLRVLQLKDSNQRALDVADQLAHHSDEEPQFSPQPDPRILRSNHKRQPRIRKVREKRYVCGVCSHRTAQKAQLVVHMRTHTGERPFPCRVQGCNKTSSQQSNRRTHERTHSGERPYKCRFCDKAFPQSGNRDAHERTHTQEKPFVCIMEDCGKQFTARGNLKAHINKFHDVAVKGWAGHLSELEFDECDAEGQEMWVYLAGIFKNSNKGVRGRGQGRFVTKVNWPSYIQGLRAESDQRAQRDHQQQHHPSNGYGY